MNKDNGGPAFPLDENTALLTMEHATGMSLRDYFAAKALPTAWAAFAGGYFEVEGWDSINEGVAVCAYQMADAMLAARSA